MPSDLQVSNIRDLTNANSAITIASDGQITVNQNNPTLTVGSNATISKSGMITNFGVVSDRTRTTVPQSAEADIEFYNIGNYNKLNANTDLIIHVVLQGSNSSNADYGNIGLKFGGSSTYWGGGYNKINAGDYMQLTIIGNFTGHTTTGSQAISCRMGTENTTTSRPCEVVNPSVTEDSRLKASGSQAFSHAIIFEVMP